MAKIRFDQDLCKGCGLCVKACPKNILEMTKKIINTKGYHPAACINEQECTGCASCARMCPDCVITVER